MPPRRSHKKSRAGCRRCKARKIKCDEVHPRCGNCLKHGVACDFEHPELVDELQTSMSATTPKSDTPAATPVTPAANFDFQSPLPTSQSAPSSTTPAPAQLHRPPAAPIVSQTTPASSRMLELRLLHQWVTTTSKTLAWSGPGTESIWRDTVPHIAFAGSNHLTDAVLAVAALHLRSLSPNDKELVSASHAYMANSIREYSEALSKGINASNAEPLFLTSTLIAFQSTATRIFAKDELSLNSTNSAIVRTSGPPGGYALPLSWFHAFQGVKAITAAGWSFLRQSGVVIPIIDSQPVLQLSFKRTEQTFFGHLLDGLDEEIAGLPASPTSPTLSRPAAASSSAAASASTSGSASGQMGESSTAGEQQQQRNTAQGFAAAAFSDSANPQATSAAATRQAYEHAVAVLNWAHKIPHKGAPLAFPATVSRRYVELLEERRPRALAILACFFALLKSLDSIWWLQGMARREVLGVASLLSSDFFGPDVERQWWPHLEWAVRVALYDDSAAPGSIPPDVWGGSWLDEDTVMAQRGSESFVSHIDMLSQMVSGLQSFPPPGVPGSDYGE